MLIHPVMVVVLFYAVVAVGNGYHTQFEYFKWFMSLNKPDCYRSGAVKMPPGPMHQVETTVIG
jgi:hypothetical protein